MGVLWACITVYPARDAPGKTDSARFITSSPAAESLVPFRWSTGDPPPAVSVILTFVNASPVRCPDGGDGDLVVATMPYRGAHRRRQYGRLFFTPLRLGC